MDNELDSNVLFEIIRSIHDETKDHGTVKLLLI